MAKKTVTAKSLSQLLPSDRVVVQFSDRNQQNADGEIVTIEKARQLDVPYSYWLTLTESKDDYNEKTGYCKMLGRKVELLGLATYKDKVTNLGEKVQVVEVTEFAEETEAGTDAGTGDPDAGAGDPNSDPPKV